MGQSLAKLDAQFTQEICDETGFSQRQVERFYYRFTALDRGGKGYLTCQDLLSIPEIKVNPLGERIVFTMYKEQGEYVHEIIKGKRPMTEEIRIPFKSFCRAFAHFRYIDPRQQSGGTGKGAKFWDPEGKLRFIFRIFDINEDGEVSCAEIFALLKLISTGADDADLLRFSEEILFESRSKDQEGAPETLNFASFCQGPIKEQIMKSCYFKFAD